MEIDRRRFVAQAAEVLAALAVSGCASVAVTRVPVTGSTVRLSLAAHPALSGRGGSLRVQPQGAATPIYVLALEEGKYAALSPICTHQGCVVDLEADRLVCPCHGSTYDRTGRVLRGPAERPLLDFPVDLSADGILVIDLGAST